MTTLADQDDAMLIRHGTPSDRILMLWRVTLDAWASAGRAMPRYRGRRSPGTSREPCAAERPEYTEDFMDLLSALEDAGGEYVVIGAHALATHGVVRASGDLYVLVRPSEANAARVIRALKTGAPAGKMGLAPGDRGGPFVFTLGSV